MQTYLHPNQESDDCVALSVFYPKKDKTDEVINMFPDPETEVMHEVNILNHIKVFYFKNPTVLIVLIVLAVLAVLAALTVLSILVALGILLL